MGSITCSYTQKQVFPSLFVKKAAISGAGVGFPFLSEMSAHHGETAMGREEPGAEVALAFGVSVGLARGLGG